MQLNQTGIHFITLHFHLTHMDLDILMLQAKVITTEHTGLPKVVLLPSASDAMIPNGLVNCIGWSDKHTS